MVQDLVLTFQALGLPKPTPGTAASRQLWEMHDKVGSWGFRTGATPLSL